MDRYQLGKLVQWAGTLRTRKRIQKVVYLLQSAGCPIQADFYLHHYGPYSSEIAGVTDVLVQQGLLVEQPTGNIAGCQFNYALTPATEERLKEYEITDAGRKALTTLEPFAELAKSLLHTDLHDLEYASTIAYFKRQGMDWHSAMQKACEFKHLDPASSPAKRSLELAKFVVR